jgi:hypothetical protein
MFDGSKSEIVIVMTTGELPVVNKPNMNKMNTTTEILKQALFATGLNEDKANEWVVNINGSPNAEMYKQDPIAGIVFNALNNYSDPSEYIDEVNSYLDITNDLEYSIRQLQRAKEAIARMMDNL